MHQPDDVLRAVRMVPVNPDSAGLTFVFTTFPGVILHAGLLHDFPFPQCGCDACDESTETAVEEMERLVFAVVAGNYSESVTEDAWLNVSYTIRTEDGSGRASSGSASIHSPGDRIEAAAGRLRALPHGWQPWEHL